MCAQPEKKKKRGAKSKHSTVVVNIIISLERNKYIMCPKINSIHIRMCKSENRIKNNIFIKNLDCKNEQNVR